MAGGGGSTYISFSDWLVPRTGLEPVRARSPGDFKSPMSTNSITPAPLGLKNRQSLNSCQESKKNRLVSGKPAGFKIGGAGRIRTADQSFAGSCLTTWPRRRKFISDILWISKLQHLHFYVKGDLKHHRHWHFGQAS